MTLTYATSLDSQISLAPGTQTILSGPESKAMTHYLRSKHDAILVGVGTALADDPGLTCRLTEEDGNMVDFERQPVPVIIDPRGRWNPMGSRVMLTAEAKKGKGIWWVVGEETEISEEAREYIDENGGRVVRGTVYRDGRMEWDDILQELRSQSCQSVMIEGGAGVINELLRPINRELVNSVIITMAPVWLGKGGVEVIPTREGGNEVGRLTEAKWMPLGQDIVLAGRLG